VESDDFGQAFEQDQQTIGEGQAFVGCDHSMRQVRQARARNRDHAPAGAAKARVEPQDADGANRRVRHTFRKHASWSREMLEER